MNNLLSDGNPNSHDQDLSQYPFQDFDPSLPLPSYTQSWGHFLRRPTKLPDNYDTRIDPNHIFVFAVHPITGIKRDFYVTPKPCEYCAKIRQVCSRSRPFCHRCTISGDPQRVCRVEDGWVKLPGPKCEKPKLQKKLLGPKTATLPSSSSPPSSVPVAKRARTIAPHPLDEGLSSLSPTPTPTASNHYEPMAIPKKPPPKRVVPITRSENVTAIVPCPKSPSAADTSVKGLYTRPDLDLKATVRAERKAGKRAGGKGVKQQDGLWHGQDHTVWRTVLPGPSVKQLPLSSRRSHPPSEGKPRIWAKDKKELIEILPELSNALGEGGSGIYMEHASLEPPMVFLANAAWSEDSMSTDGLSAEISFVREFTVLKERITPYTGKAVDFSGDQDMMLVDEVPPQKYSISAPLLEHSSQPPPRGRDNACHPSRTLTNSNPRSAINPPIASTSRSVNDQSSEPESRKTDSPFQSSHWRYSTRPPFSQPANPLNRLSHTSTSPALTLPAGPSPSITGAFGGVGATSHQSNWFSISPPVPRPTPTQSAVDGKNLKCNTQSYPLDLKSKFLAEVSVKVNFTLRPARFPSTDSVDSDTSTDSNSERDWPLSRKRKRPASPRRNGGSEGLPPKMFKHNLDRLNHRLIGLVPEDDPEKELLVKTHIDQEYWSTFIPQDVPPEIKHLLDCHAYKIPLVLTVSYDYCILPFDLPLGCGIAVMGFYRIIDVAHKQELYTDDGKSRTSRATWRFKLRWIPGGENVPEGQQQPLHPWWQPPPSLDAPKPIDTPSPYSLLPMHLHNEPEKPDDDDQFASEVHTRKGWHCRKCGRLNVQRLLGAQKCGTCETGNRLLPVEALYVRDPHKTTPDTTPVDTYPASVSCRVLDAGRNVVRTFLYTIDEGVEIKHVFTCNRPALQTGADHLFREIQRRVPMAWQGAKTKLAAGPYYTYLAGPGNETPPNVVAWANTPRCLQDARKMIELYARDRVGDLNFRAETLTVLGWTSPGSRKSPTPLPAKKLPVAILCLGADVELRVAPVSGFAKSSQPPPVIKRSASVALRQAQHTVDRAVDDDPFDSPLSGASSDEEALSVRHPSKDPGAVPRSKAKKPAESMLITLVHGDMVIFYGDDFEYTLHRTGMSIVLITQPWAGTHGLLK